MNCPRLHPVVLPQSIRTIGDAAFLDCPALRSINIPPSVTTIGEYAFNICSALETVHIPPSVTHIGSYVFNSCHALKSINIAPAITVDARAFYGCTVLASLAGCDPIDSDAIVEYLRSLTTSRINLRYSVLMAIKRHRVISEELTTTLAERRELARAKLLRESHSVQ